MILFSFRNEIFICTVAVMWGRTYARQGRARDIRRTAERAAARDAARAAVTADKDGRSGPSG
jgi:hypothetical protein